VTHETYLFARTVIAAVLLVVCALPAARVLAEEAAPSASYSADQLSQSGDWLRLRDPRFTQGHVWSLADGWMTNAAPPGTPEEDIRKMKDGMGLCLYVWDRPHAPSADITGVFQFDAHAAAGFILSARVDGNMLLDHYLVLVYHGGVNVWRYTYTGEGRFQGRYLKLGWRALPLASDRDVTLAVTYETKATSADFMGGRVIQVRVDGEPWFAVTDADPLPLGKIGLWLGEGSAKVKDVSIRHPQD